MQAFINERSSPELLSYETELVERVQAQLQYQVTDALVAWPVRTRLTSCSSGP